MGDDFTNMIDPAFQNVDNHCRLELVKYFKNLPDEEKSEYGIVPLKPSIPNTRKEVNALIEDWINLFEAPTSEAEEDLKDELLDLCEMKNIPVDSSLPLNELKEAIRTYMRRASIELFLEKGIFGPEITKEEADENLQELLIHYIREIKMAAYSEILKEIGKEPKSNKMDYEGIAVKFPDLVNFVKQNIFHRNSLN